MDSGKVVFGAANLLAAFVYIEKQKTANYNFEEEKECL